MIILLARIKRENVSVRNSYRVHSTIRITLQKTDNNRCTIFYNQVYNCLDLFYLLNYTALALSMSYVLDQSSDQAQMTVVSAGVLVGLYVVTLMVTVLHHHIVVILKACKMYDRAREKINGLII